MTESAILKKARTRGYWEVVVRPASFQEGRIPNILELPKAVAECAVEFRGWDFPHYDTREAPRIGDTWVWQELDWENYVEYWRASQTGQFFYTGGIRYDWFDQSNWSRPTHHIPAGPLLGIGDTVFKFTEIYEFAARFSRRLEFDEGVVIRVALRGLEGRALWVDGGRRAPLFQRHVFQVREVVLEQRVELQELTARVDDLAAGQAREVFRRCGWDPTLELMRGQQEELRTMKGR